jgi:hypothetical protein
MQTDLSTVAELERDDLGFWDRATGVKDELGNTACLAVAVNKDVLENLIGDRRSRTAGTARKKTLASLQISLFWILLGSAAEKKRTRVGVGLQGGAL